VSRYGENEFVVLLPQIDHAQDAADIAAKLLACGALPYAVRRHEVRMSFSVGIALHPEDGDDGGTLLRHADLAMKPSSRAATRSGSSTATATSAPGSGCRWNGDCAAG
jgi:GGDEF domain-containing protein